LTAALFLGFKREEAARFSFLLGLPAIALAGLKELPELRHAGLDAHGWLVLAVGLVIGSLSAFVRSGSFCASSSASRLRPLPSTGHLSARYCSQVWRPDGSPEIWATVP
jgi:undecaprenyl pyrophosphate phosphatase UppP